MLYVFQVCYLGVQTIKFVLLELELLSLLFFLGFDSLYLKHVSSILLFDGVDFLKVFVVKRYVDLRLDSRSVWGPSVTDVGSSFKVLWTVSPALTHLFRFLHEVLR